MAQEVDAHLCSVLTGSCALLQGSQSEVLDHTHLARPLNPTQGSGYFHDWRLTAEDISALMPARSKFSYPASVMEMVHSQRRDKRSTP